MTFLAHALSGAVIGAVLTETTGANYTITALVCIVFSLLPDLNLIWKKISDHHRDFTHYPIFWLMVVAVVFLMEYFTGSTTFILTLSLFASTFVHLLLDTFGITLGVHWLAPFNYHEYSFTSLDKSGLDRSPKEKAVSFYKSKHILYELGIISFATLVVLEVGFRLFT